MENVADIKSPEPEAGGKSVSGEGWNGPSQSEVVGDQQTEFGAALMRVLSDKAVQHLEAHSPCELLVAVREADTDRVKDLCAAGADLDGGYRPGGTPLLVAAFLGFEDVVEALLDSGADVDATSTERVCTALHVAAYFGRVEIVQALCAAGAAVNRTDAFEVRALFLAESAAVSRTLLEYGADVNLRCGPEMRTALHAAVDVGNAEGVRFLCTVGADVNRTDARGMTPLHLTVRLRNGVEMASALIGAGADKGCSGPEGFAPLHEAGRYGCADLVRLLCSAGVEVDRASDEGKTALHCCMSHADTTAAVEVLLEYGADVNRSYGPSNRTALHVASANGHHELVRLVCRAGARIEQVGTEGAAPLHLAAAFGGTEAVTALLECGADVNCVTEKYGFTPLHIAAKGGSAELVRVMCAAGAKVDAIPSDGLTALCYAVHFGNVSVAAALLVGGAEVDRVDAHGKTALHWSISSDSSAAAVSTLLNAGADVDRPSGHKLRTALHLAALLGRTEPARVLCAGGAKVDQKDAEGRTALHLAALMDEAGVARVLLERGADPNATRSDGEPPLLDAVRIGSVELVGLLCEGGAAVDRLDSSGKTALYFAVLHDKGDVARVLLEHGAREDAPESDQLPPLYLAAVLGHAKVARALCAAGSNLQVMNNFGLTPLHAAARAGFDEVVQVLLEHGADVNTRDSSLVRTPLYLAAESLRSKCVRTLCEAGADTSIQSSNGRTPLAEATLSFDVDTIAALCEFGADPNSPIISTPLFTPLIFSALHGRADVVKMLLKAGAHADLCGENGVTSLYGAADLNRHAVLEELLLAGADTEARPVGPERETSLQAACRKSNVESVLVLLRGGADEAAPVRVVRPCPRPSPSPRCGGAARAAQAVRATEAPAPVTAAAAVAPVRCMGRAAPAPALAPVATSLDLVGMGKLNPGQDPEERCEGETDEQFAARRDPTAIKRIREALLQATRDKLWARRGGLVMLRARLEKDLPREARRERGEGRDRGKRRAVTDAKRTTLETTRREGDRADGRIASDIRATPEGKRKRTWARQEEGRGRSGEGGQGGADKLGVLGKRRAGELPTRPAGKLLKTGVIVVDHRQMDGGQALGAVGRGGVCDVSEIVALGAGAAASARGLASDEMQMVDEVNGDDGCGVVGCCASSADLREGMGRLLELAQVEEGAFRHVACFL
eukprot:jgi/Undpi1/930/HiC_scaffold_10.g04394.m1